MGTGGGAPGVAPQHNVYAQGAGVPPQQFESGGAGHGGTRAGFGQAAPPHLQTTQGKPDDGGKHLQIQLAVSVVLRIVTVVLALISLALVVSARTKKTYDLGKVDYTTTTLTVDGKALRTNGSK